MLILSRRCGESIIVDDEVTLTVLSIKGKQVRIGIDAPDHVSVHREEIYQRIKDGDIPAAGKAQADSPDSSDGSSTSEDNPESGAQAEDQLRVTGAIQSVEELAAASSIDVSAPAATPIAASIAAEASDPKLV